MKHISRLFLLIFLAVMIALALPGQAQAKDAADDKVVFGDTYRLGSGQTLNGNLAVLGGTATLDSGSTVNGDAALMGGTLDINGTVTGNVSTLGGTLFLGDSAVINGDVTMMGGTLHRSAGAKINGSVVNGGFMPFQVSLPNMPFGWLDNFHLTPIWNYFMGVLSTLLMAALAVLVVLFWPRPTERVARATISQPVITGGLGLLTAIVVPALLVMLAITLILIPLSLLGFLVLGIAFLFGWIAVGLEVGNKIAELFKQQWNPAVAAGLGTLVLGLISNSVGWVPCIGWLVPVMAALLGLGGVVITRFGTQVYPTSLAPAYPAAPAAAAAGPVYSSQTIDVTPAPVRVEPQPVEPPAPGNDQDPAI